MANQKQKSIRRSKLKKGKFENTRGSDSIKNNLVIFQIESFGHRLG